MIDVTEITLTAKDRLRNKKRSDAQFQQSQLKWMAVIIAFKREDQGT